LYLLTLASVTAHYAAYSYIEPFLARVAGMSDGRITSTLVLFGAAGIVASALFSRCFDRAPLRFIGTAFAGIAAALLALRPAASHPALLLPLCAAWGVAFIASNLVLQAEVIRLAPRATAVAMSIFSGICNVGIGAGALLGGAVCTRASVADVGYVGGLVALAAVLVCFRLLLPRLRALSVRTEKQL
ncbi:MAG: sugar transporter, partial [Alistipes sp.]|nr:sugar transporter [Alistipes sp.]